MCTKYDGCVSFNGEKQHSPVILSYLSPGGWRLDNAWGRGGKKSLFIFNVLCYVIWEGQKRREAKNPNDGKGILYIKMRIAEKIGYRTGSEKWGW